jgi:hypothetical protein
VPILDINETEAKQAAKEIDDEGGEAAPYQYQCDVSNLDRTSFTGFSSVDAFTFW